MDYTVKLAEFCADLSLERLPAEVVRQAKMCLLDFVANVYGSLELEAAGRVVAYIKSLNGRGPAAALGLGFSLDVNNAAFLNGTMAEAIEAQDGLRFGGNHPGTAVIPAALALAEERGQGGGRVIEAIVCGYEAANRPAAAMHPWHTLSGFLPTGTCGAFGAAAAAGKILGFNADLMTNALGAAGYLLPLSMAEQLMGGFTIKIVQGGAAAVAGLMAAGLAKFGLTGAPYVLEGSALKGGFTQITTKAEPKLERLAEGLGTHFSIMDLYFKPYTACRHTHGAAQAILELLAEEPIRPDDVERVEVKTYGIAELAVGKSAAPGSSFVSAQFSIPYTAAACLLDGELGPRQLTEKRMADPRIHALAAKVKVSTDAELNGLYPDKTASQVEIVLANGAVRKKRVDTPLGDPRVPLGPEGLTQKLFRFAGDRDRARVGRVAEMALNFEKISDISEFTKMI
ncbi:MAG: MmgE/PrpD family protein [Pseudomonadota bacterium]